MADTVDPARILQDVLTERGPLGKPELAESLRDAGVAEPDLELRADRFELTCPVGELVDERFAWLPHLLAGRIFTHRLGAVEVAQDALLVTPDLSPIAALSEHAPYERLTDGSSIYLAVADYDDELLEERGIAIELDETVLLLDPGTLAGLPAGEGDLIGLRLTGQGLSLEKVEKPIEDTDIGARLAEALGPDEPEFFEAAVWTVCSADKGLFTEPLPPLSDIADASGLAHRGAWLAESGFDFNRWDFDRGCARLAQRHGLEDAEAVAVHTLIQLYEVMGLMLEAATEEVPSDATERVALDSVTDTLPDVIGELGAALADPMVAEVLVDETVGSGGDGAATLAVFAEVLESRVPRSARVACRWLRAVALERGGDVAAAERELLAAESMDTDWPLPLFDLARFASDRGDAEHGLALLRRAGADDEFPLVELLQQFRITPRSDVGRNEPCWCGSGRKYKKCHLGNEELPLATRARWLYAKAIQHAGQGGWDELLHAVSLERCPDAESLADMLAEALADPLVLDAVLFEGGAFAEFLAQRGSLLPEDERALAEQWATTTRSVFEVEQVHRGQGSTLRDVRSGTSHQVPEVVIGGGLQPGQLICARLIPVADTVVCFGGTEPVADDERDALVALLDAEPDAVQLVAQLSGRQLAR